MQRECWSVGCCSWSRFQVPDESVFKSYSPHYPSFFSWMGGRQRITSPPAISSRHSFVCLKMDCRLSVQAKMRGMMACSVIHPSTLSTSAVNESLPMNCLKMETLCRRGNSRFLLIHVSQHFTTPRTHFHYHPVVDMVRLINSFS